MVACQSCGIHCGNEILTTDNGTEVCEVCHPKAICETCGDTYLPGDPKYCCYGCFIIAGEEKDVK